MIILFLLFLVSQLALHKIKHELLFIATMDNYARVSAWVGGVHPPLMSALIPNIFLGEPGLYTVLLLRRSNTTFMNYFSRRVVSFIFAATKAISQDKKLVEVVYNA